MTPDAMVGVYDYRLVALSIFISELGAYAVLDLAERRNAARGGRWRWLLGGAIASGMSTWSMHYTAMAALNLPVPVVYHWPTVVLSYLPAALSAAAALVLVGSRNIGWKPALIGSALMGAGIAALHYTAMDAMRFRGMHYYDPTLVVLSVVVPMLIVLVPLKLTFLSRDRATWRALRKILSVLLLGAANPAMHYTGMAGTTFVSAAEPDLSQVVNISSLTVAGLSLVTGMVISVALLTSLVDRLREQRALLHDLFEQAQSFSQRLIATQEAERQRVARQLHDEIGQTLTAIRVNLDAMKHAAGGAPLSTGLQESMEIIDRALQQVRDLSLDLRPMLLDEVGLAAALRSHANREAQRAGLTLEVVADELEARLPPEIETACFRIAQEALTNVARHAQARHVRVELHCRGGGLNLIIQDDGAGFDPRALRNRPAVDARLGLLGMKERALIVGGTVQIISARGRGTQIHAWFPLPSSSSAEEAVT